jgi:hypothetical protein
MAVEYLGTGNDDGVVMGRSTTDKISFYGVSPAVQYSTTALATKVITIKVYTSIRGFASTAGFNKAIAQLEACARVIRTLGLGGTT